MPTVTCPSCSTGQAVASDADAYVCVSCGASWRFVTCDTCGSRFHARPRSTGWTCPNCGTPHGTSAGPEAIDPQSTRTDPPPSLAVKGDDLEAAEPEPLGGRQEPFDIHEPGPSFPMPRRADRHRTPPWMFVAVAAVAVIVVIALFLFLRRDGDPAPAAPSTTGEAAAREKMCSDVQQLQVLRTDALGRAQDDLKADVAALKAAGDTATAKQVRRLVSAVGDVREALADQQDSTEATAAMAKAVAKLDC